jgi:phosphohistidine phosphatase SixA
MNRNAALTYFAACFLFCTLASASIARNVVTAQFKLSDLKNADIVLLRHANAPGVGDPSGFKLGDCSTQRNLDDVGRARSRRIGELLRTSPVKVGAVWSSQWCRTRETAALAFPELVVRDVTAFNSFFAERNREPDQLREAMKLLRQWQGPGVLLVVAHQVNITSLSGIVPASGEAVVVRWRDGALRTLGRFTTSETP